MDDATRARFDTFDRGYESFYVKAHDPDTPRGFWIRYTVMRRPGAATAGSVWITMFGSDGPRALKVTPDAPPSHDDATWIRVGDALLGQDGLHGTASRDGIDAAWDLRFASDEQPLFHLPSSVLYRAPIPRTKPVSPLPLATFDGTVRIGDRRFDVAGWPGMLGHNWGAEHAERWIWLHMAGSEQDADTWVDVVLGRIKLGPLTTPWIANGAVSIEGKRLRVGGIERARATEVDERPDRARVALPSKAGRIEIEVTAPPLRIVGWRYGHPDGSEHHVANCSIASMTVRMPDGRTLESAHGATYELGMREQDHGIPLQPWAD